MTSEISALMDGELDADEAVRTLKALRQDARLRETWATYHLIGDSLRDSGPLAVDITARVSRRLAEEPAVPAPSRRNTAWRAWSLPMALAASIAAVGFVGLLAFQLGRLAPAPSDGVQVAAGRPVPAVAAPVAAAPAAAPQSGSRRTAEPPRVRFPAAAGDAYLLAHQEFSPAYVMAGLPVYVRAVSEQDAGQ